MCSKIITPQNNAANQVNKNHGTSGTNRQYDQNQGNRGAQLDPNRPTAEQLKEAEDQMAWLEKAFSGAYNVTSSVQDEISEGDTFDKSGE